MHFFTIIILFRLILLFLNRLTEVNNQNTTRHTPPNANPALSEKELLNLLQQFHDFDFDANKIGHPFLVRLSRSYAFNEMLAVNKDFTYSFLIKAVKNFKSENSFWALIDSYQAKMAIPAIAYWYQTKAINLIENWTISPTDDHFVIVSELLSFLFERYNVPAPLRNTWFYWNYQDSKQLSIEVGFTEKAESDLQIADNVFFSWYFTVAEGKNLRKHEFLPFEMSKNTAYFFSIVSENHSLMQAFSWAKAKGLGANDTVAELMAMELPIDFNRNEQYVDDICFLLMRSATTDANAMKEAVRFLKMVALGEFCYEYHGHLLYFMKNLLPFYSLKGRTVATLLRFKSDLLKKMPNIEHLPTINDIDFSQDNGNTWELKFRNFTAYIMLFSKDTRHHTSVWNIATREKNNIIASINRNDNDSLESNLAFRLSVFMTLQEVPVAAYSSIDSNENFYFKNENGVDFEIVRLKNYVELFEEGQAMSHCVADYDEQCISGETTIWSLREIKSYGPNIRLVTIEWKNNGIVQACGYENREPLSYENDIIEIWKAQMLGNQNTTNTQAQSETAVPVEF